jgi:hypothetical protein
MSDKMTQVSVLSEGFDHDGLRAIESQVSQTELDDTKYEGSTEDVSRSIVERAARGRYLRGVLQEARRRSPKNNDLADLASRLLQGAMPEGLHDLYDLFVVAYPLRAERDDLIADLGDFMFRSDDPEVDWQNILLELADRQDDDIARLVARVDGAEGSPPRDQLIAARETYLDHTSRVNEYAALIAELERQYPEEAAARELVAVVVPAMADEIWWDSPKGVWHAVIRRLSLSRSALRLLVKRAAADTSGDSALAGWAQPLYTVKQDPTAYGSGGLGLTTAQPGGILLPMDEPEARIHTQDLKDTLSDLAQLIDGALNDYRYRPDLEFDTPSDLDELVALVVQLYEKGASQSWQENETFDHFVVALDRARISADELADAQNLGRIAKWAAKAHAARAVAIRRNEPDGPNIMAVLLESLVPYWKMKAAHADYQVKVQAAPSLTPAVVGFQKDAEQVVNVFSLRQATIKATQ